jgi:hypothetical protein
MVIGGSVTCQHFFEDFRPAVSVGKGEKCKYPLECQESRHDGLASDTS